MKQILLTQGFVALVDDEDYQMLVDRGSWHYNNSGYAAREEPMINGARGKMILMHNIINPPPEGLENDHIDRNPLDNRKVNLHHCTRSQNQLNSPPRGGSSRFKGVNYHKAAKKWRTQIRIDGKLTHLGLFDTEEDAAGAYDAVAKILYKHAYLNFPEADELCCG